MESFEALEIYQKVIYGNISNGEFFYRKAEADAEISKIMKIAYPDGPMADAAVAMSRYEPLLKSEREIRDKLARLEAEIERVKKSSCDIKELKRVIAERDRLFEIAYPDGPAADAAIPCSRFVEVRDERDRLKAELRDRTEIVEIKYPNSATRK